MRYIEKGQEPDRLSEWRAAKPKNPHKSWKNVPKDVKDAIRDSLMKEQGFICCYCGCRVSSIDDSHVEHLIPKCECKEALPNGERDYSNLLISCQRDPKPPANPHCGSSKGDKELMISPLQPDCETKFHFDGGGHVEPADGNDDVAKETIEMLALNCRNLWEQRSQALNIIFAKGLSDDEIRRQIDFYSRKDAAGRFKEFCFVIVQNLQWYLGG